MRTLLKGGVAGAVLLVIVYGAMTWGTGRDKMALPHRVTTRADGRAVVQLQICWWPEHVGGVIRTTLGGLQKADVELDIPCSRPWVTQGVVDNGDRIALGWTLNPNKDIPRNRDVDYRVLMNNREVKRATAHTDNGQFECMAGVPPCVP